MKKRFSFNEWVQTGEFNPDGEFEILTTAKQYDSRYGEFQYSIEELREMAENFNNNVVGTELAVDLNHDQDCIALAWILPNSMRVAESSKLAGQYSLYCKLYKFTPKGEEYLKTGAVRYFSVELWLTMERVINGTKKVFKNVLRGLALTNRPVVKDMAPTFSEKNINHNLKNMNKFKELSEALLAKDKVTIAELSELKKLADEAVEADEAVKEEVETVVSEVEAKVETEDEDETEDQKADLSEIVDTAVKKALSEMSKSSFTTEEVAVLLADATKNAVQEPLRKLNEALDVARVQKLSAQVNALSFSEDKSVGIKAGEKDKVLNFVKKLSDKLAAEYFEIHQNAFTSVDLSEHGHAEEAENAGTDEIQKELESKATAYSEKNNIKYTDAVKRVLAEDEELAKKIQKAYKSA